MTSDILIDMPAEGVKRLTLNRPEKFNAFTFAMYSALIAELEVLRYDPAVRVVILTGAGRGFCAGHDAAGAGEPNWAPKNVGRIQDARYRLGELGRIPILMRQIPQPIICAVNGAAAGIGYALALASDMTLAAASAKFVNAIHNAGTGAELGMSWLLPRQIGSQRAAEILLTMRPVLSEEAERIGLVLKSVPDEALMDEALALAERIKLNVPIGVALTKQSMWANQSVASLEAAIEFESRAVVISQSTEDTAEKRRALAEKRSPHFSNH